MALAVDPFVSSESVMAPLASLATPLGVVIELGLDARCQCRMLVQDQHGAYGGGDV